jgi:hypothetical protein
MKEVKERGGRKTVKNLMVPKGRVELPRRNPH